MSKMNNNKPISLQHSKTTNFFSVNKKKIERYIKKEKKGLKITNYGLSY